MPLHPDFRRGCGSGPLTTVAPLARFGLMTFSVVPLPDAAPIDLLDGPLRGRIRGIALQSLPAALEA